MDGSESRRADVSALLRTQYSVLSTQYLILTILASGLVPFPAWRIAVAAEKPAKTTAPSSDKLTAEIETPSPAADGLGLESTKDSIIIPPGRPAWTDEGPSTS